MTYHAADLMVSVVAKDGDDAKAAPASAPDPNAEPSDASSDGRKDKKERVLHTRIPAVLEQELKRFADNLRVPVSNLVRTILEDALAVADRATGVVEAELHAAAKAAGDKREALRSKLQPKTILDEVFAFQPIVLAQPTRCTGCGVDLARGADAWMGLRETPGPRVVACAACVPARDAT